MKPWLICATTVVCAMQAGMTPAAAGYWNYGCKGSLGETAIMFDRNTFVMMPKALAKGDIAGLVKDVIFGFDADDNNSGFLPVMKFARGGYPDQQIILTERSTKKMSERKGRIGTRDTVTTQFTKTYHYQRLGWSGSPEADVAMECIEYQRSAP